MQKDGQEFVIEHSLVGGKVIRSVKRAVAKQFREVPGLRARRDVSTWEKFGSDKNDSVCRSEPGSVKIFTKQEDEEDQFQALFKNNKAKTSRLGLSSKQGGESTKKVYKVRRTDSTGTGGAESVETTTKIRITSLPPNTKDEDLADLLRSFQGVRKSTLLADRGLAFVEFTTRAQAEEAKQHLHRMRYGHFVLNVDWAQPQVRDGGSGGTTFRSGYGRKLAQDA